MGKILVAHRDLAVLDDFRGLLEKDGHWVLTLPQIEELPNRILSHRPDLVLLSNDFLAGPQKDFVHHLRRLSLGPTIPIVLLTKKAGAAGLRQAFAATGADGLLPENQSGLTEISNSVRGFLERPPGQKGLKKYLRYGHLELDRANRSARLGVAIVTDLPKRLFEVLWLLVKRAVETNEISPRDLLIAKIWKTRVRDREVDVVISRLKDRVPFLADYIETIPGKGYRFTLPSLSTHPVVRDLSPN